MTPLSTICALIAVWLRIGSKFNLSTLENKPKYFDTYFVCLMVEGRAQFFIREAELD
jgi:hypothetical protein